MHTHSDFELVDFGEGARLERFGERTVDRPHPTAFGARQEPGAWSRADLCFDRDRGWTGLAAGAGPWLIELQGVAMELRATEAGQVGLFPEHLAMLPWLRARLAELASATHGLGAPAPAVLNLFAHTGLGTLAMAGAGSAVTHVDSSRPTVAWARRNAERNRLHDRPIRWIVDDALGYTQREARRGRRYAGLVLDPPSYGHGPVGRPWRFEEDIATLLEAGAGLLEPGGFVLLTAHSPGFDGNRLASVLSDAFPRPVGAFESGELAVTTKQGRRLDLGAFARWPAGAS